MPTVLILCASPSDQDKLRLGAEEKGIRNALQRSNNRQHWQITSNQAATVDDLRRALLDCGPSVVHFAGHGDGAGGLCFEDEAGNTHFASGAPLARLFHNFREHLKCVVLNACFSKVQAELIRNEIDYVVGMKSSIGDEPAMKFAVAFYDALFAGTDFRMAFDLGCSALDLHNLPDVNVPEFLTAPHLGNTTLLYSAMVPEIERILLAYKNAPFLDRASFTTTGLSLVTTLKRHYGENIHHECRRVRVLGMASIGDDCWRVECQILERGTKNTSIYYIRIRGMSVLVEWEASVGLWSVPATTFLSVGSDNEVVARVTAKLHNMYIGSFNSLQTIVQSVLLQTIDHVLIYAYVSRGSPTFGQLMGILADGNSHSITVGLADTTGDSSTPMITKLLSPSWIFR